MPKKREDGRYELKVRISRPGEPRKYKAVYGSTLREAQEKKRKLEAEVQAGVDAQANATVDDLIRGYLSLKAVTVKPQTIGTYSSHLKHVSALIGSSQARLITVDKARAVMDEIAEELPKTANRCLKYMKAIYNDGIVRGLVSTNPWSAVPRRIAEPTAKRALTDEELSIIDNANLIPMDRALVAVLRYTGMRIGEAIALTVDDVDFDSQTISINKACYKGVLGSPKTKAGNRTVPMPEKLSAILRPYITEYVGDGYLFLSGRGTLFGACSLNNRWSKIRTAIFGKNAPSDFTPHIFRHTYTSLLVKNNVPVTTAMLVLGHDDYKTTMNIYTHLGYKDIDADRVRSLF